MRLRTAVRLDRLANFIIVKLHRFLLRVRVCCFSSTIETKLNFVWIVRVLMPRNKLVILKLISMYSYLRDSYAS